MSNRVTFAELQELTGLSQPAAIARTLRGQGVPVFTGRNGCWTTQEALNQALGVTQAKDKQAVEIEF